MDKVRILSLLVENNPGVLARISSLVSGKGYNLESLTVGLTNDNTISRITLVCKSDEFEFEQIKKQLNKLIDVIKVIDLTKPSTLKKEMAFIKVSVKKTQKSELFLIINALGYKVTSFTSENIIIEACDQTERIDELIILLQPYGIIEIVRSGLIAMDSN